MAHIVEFAVSNLAGRKGVYTKKLNRHVNIFFGLNGTGKTSLLRILNAAMERNATLLVNVPFASARVRIYSDDYSKDFTYSIDREKFRSRLSAQLEFLGGLTTREQVAGLRGLPRRIRRQLQLEWEVDPPQPPDATKRWRHAYLPTTRLVQMVRPSYGEADDLFESEDFLDEYFESALKSQYLHFFGEIQVRVRQSQQKALVDILRQVLETRPSKRRPAGALDWHTAYDQMVSFLKRQNPKAEPSSQEAFRTSYEQSAILREVVARIDRVEREIEAAMAPRTKLETLIRRMFSGNKELRFSDTSVEVVTQDEGDIGLRSLSSGEKHILCILLEAIRVRESSLIIDEPEISMHVDWQRELISALQELNPEAQIIAATHSPEITAKIGGSKIFRL